MSRTLVVVAHPDDPEFQAGGTIAHWTAAGDEVAYCVVTDGDAGGFPPTVPGTERARIRRAEQRAAAAVLGVSTVHFLGHPDGRLLPTLEVRRDIARVIRVERPDRVLAQSPEFNWAWLPDTHPDHRAAGEAAMAAVYPDARNALAHPELAEEGLEPWTVAETWIMAGPRSDHVVDVADTMSIKLKALAEHTSQTAHMADLNGHVRRRLQATAARHGLGAGRMAEAFQVLSTG